MNDLISRRAAIDEIENTSFDDYGDYLRAKELIENLPSVQPERLTNDDFETIRIHLNAYKEKLCNQRRWKEAEEYQRIIDRFMAFASVQPQPEEDCDTCKHGYFGDRQCDNCRVRYPSHYEREEEHHGSD